MTAKMYQTDEELRLAIEEYFSDRENRDKPLTITGLAYALGFADRRSFYDYENNGEHSHTIKRARLFIESGYEERLHGTSPTGAIFALKNFGWVDKHEPISVTVDNFDELEVVEYDEESDTTSD
jgi:hypothetical protein